MPSIFGTVATAALAFATLGTSHLIMKTPVPFGVSTLNNSPLLDADPFDSGSGSDYPCKQRPGVYDITAMNHMVVGQSQELSFMGSASHGGGTCQIAVTLDEKPTVNSAFKIIQVFEGGCPIDSDGNGLTHPFTFVIPKDFPNGVATLTWVWYNRIGNREIYMNCAPITVTGGSDSHDYFNSLPNLYLINLPTTQCQDTYEYESNAVTIPHPGQFIMKETANQDMHAAVGSNCSAKAAAQLQGVVGYKSAVVTTNGAAYKAPATNMDVTGNAPAATQAASSGSAGSSPASSSAAPTSSSSNSAAATGLITISTVGSAPASSAAASSAPASSAAAAASSAPASSAAASSSYPQMTPSASAGVAAPSGAVPSGVAPSAPAGTGSSSSCSGGMACSSDGKRFALCGGPGGLVWQDVAPGTSCKNGQIVKRSVFTNPHVRKHVALGGQHGHYDMI